MQKTTYINTRIDPQLKSSAEEVFEVLGLSHSTAINLFYKQIVIQGGLPFAVHIPNYETLKSMELTSQGKKITEYDTIEEVIADSKSW
jgi:DNA-damage-inducible protein J